MKLLTKAVTIFDWTLNLLAALAAILIAFLMLMVVTEVIMRYFLARPITGVIEIAEYSLLFITFLAATWILREEGHVRMDLVLDRLKPRTQALTNVITSVMSAIVCFTLVWYGVKVTWEHFQINYLLPTPLRPPSFIIVAIVPIGYWLLFAQFLRRGYGYLVRWRGDIKPETRGIEETMRL